ncbi:hypothetical protein L2E82_24885 [Cichorium intybus]|uniref:Uncharacterized protein n=1 Tax=Cichorium intybus TaxID=13427 RepID=A0ACB9E328_CICIN|nr:hypothetical protein L2E82_24885 [Cichorium intybus]
MEETEKGKGNPRWNVAIANIAELSSNLNSIEKLLAKKAVYVDLNTYNRVSLTSEQARTIKVLEQRVETLERELDAAISASAHARIEKRHAEAGQKAAEIQAEEMTKELENTTKVFELHMEELRTKQEEISKRDKEIKLLKTVVKSLGGNDLLEPKNTNIG